jgi:hypothetical protein
MKNTKKMIGLFCSTGAENMAAGAGSAANEPKGRGAMKILERMSSTIQSIQCAGRKQARPATTGSMRVFGFSLIALLAVFMVACGSLTSTQNSAQGLSGDWSILFTLEPSGLSDPGSATFSSDPGTGEITGSISLTTEANDPGTFDVTGTIDGSTGTFTLSFAGVCAEDDTDVTATLTGTASGSSMSGNWTESASSGGWCEAGSGIFTGTGSASASYQRAIDNAQRAGKTHSDRVFMRGVVPRHTP